MRQRAQELQAERGTKGAAKREREFQACVETIDGLSGVDQALAKALHQIVLELAPELDPKTWYGFPAYAKDGKVLVFVQLASKFSTRYPTVGFSENAELDEGDMWPTSFAVVAVTETVKEQIADLVTKAVRG